MTTLTTGPKFDLACFSLAFELHDAQTQLQYYAEDADLCILRPGHPDTPPHTVHGRSKILDWLTDLFENFSQVRAVQQVDGQDEVALIAECRRADVALTPDGGHGVMRLVDLPRSGCSVASRTRRG